MIRAIFIAILFSVPAFAQTWNQAESLTNLLTRTPVVGGWYSVKGYRTPGDWGSERTAQYVRGDTAATNMGNVFAWSGGRLKFFDSTNTVQDVRWWGANADSSSDDAASIQAVFDSLRTVGGRVMVPSGAGVYTVGTGIVVTNSTDLEIQRGAVVNATTIGDYGSAFTWRGSLGSASALHAAASIGAINVTLASDMSLSSGDLIAITSTNLWNNQRPTYYQGEFAYVRDVTGATNVILMAPLRDSYVTAGTGARKINLISGRVFGGGRIACGTKVVAISAEMAELWVEDIEMRGSQYAHASFKGAKGGGLLRPDIQASGGESDGFGYGATIVFSEDIAVRGGKIETTRHGVTTGSGSTNGFAPIVNRGIIIEGVSFGAYGTNAASADFHGNTESSVIRGNTLRRGASIGGNKIVVEDNLEFGNPVNQPAMYIGEQRGREFTIRNNQFLINPLATSWIRDRIARADYVGVSTNNYLGDYGAWHLGPYTIEDNTITVLQPAAMSSSTFFAFVDVEDGLPGSLNFGPFRYARNTFVVPGLSGSALANGIGLYLEFDSQTSWQSIDVSENTFGPMPAVISGDAPMVTVLRNSWTNAVPASGAVRVVGTRGIVGQTEIAGNVVRGTPGVGMLVLDQTGRVILRDNEIQDWGNAGGANGAFFVGRSALATTNLSTLVMSGNRYRSSNASSVVLQGSSSGTRVTYYGEDIPSGMTHNDGTFASFVGVDDSSGQFSIRGAPLTLEDYATAALPASANGSVAYDATTSQMVGRIGGSWLTLLNSRTYPGFDADAFAAPFGAQVTRTNAGGWVSAWTMGNYVASSNLYGHVDLWAGGNFAAGNSFGVAFSQNGSDEYRAPAYLDSVLSLDSTGNLSINGALRGASGVLTNGLTLTAQTNVVTYGAGFTASPTSTARALVAYAISTIGRELTAAADASAARTLLGLGTLATIGDAPIDGNQYVRSNATWAVASGGGGGGSTLSLDADIGAGATNVTGITVGSGDLFPTHSWQVTGTSGNVTLTSFELGGPLWINGGTTADGQRWNVNNSTPAAPVGGVNIKWQTGSSNASAYVPFGVWTNIVAVGGVTNSSATNTVWTITLPPLDADGDAALFSSYGAIYNATGSPITWDPIITVDGGQKLRTSWSVGSSGSKRSLAITGGIRRLSSTVAHIWANLDHSGFAATTNGGYGGTLSAVRMQEYPVTATSWSSGTNTLEFRSTFNTQSTNVWLHTFGVTGEKR